MQPRGETPSSRFLAEKGDGGERGLLGRGEASTIIMVVLHSCATGAASKWGAKNISCRVVRIIHNAHVPHITLRDGRFPLGWIDALYARKHELFLSRYLMFFWFRWYHIYPRTEGCVSGSVFAELHAE